MKKKRLENRQEIKERIKENPIIEKKEFEKLLRKAVKPFSKRSD